MTDDVRLDKWLWAARLFKTRGLAAEAVSGGLVHVDGARAKPAKPVRVGAVLALRRGEVEMEVIVRGLDDRRRPSIEAALLYEETEKSRLRREERTARRRDRLLGSPERAGRPDKKARREGIRFRRGG